MEKMDLHCHTVCSDGQCTPCQVLSLAERRGLSLFAVSDHNSVAAYKEIKENRTLFSGKILPAVELNTTFEDEVIEILGYGIDVEQMAGFIGQNYLSLPDKWAFDARKMAQKCEALGAKIDLDFLNVMKTDPKSHPDFNKGSMLLHFLDKIREHPENRRFFTPHEEFDTLKSANWFRKYIFSPKGTFYLSREGLFPTPQAVVDAIHKAGGLAFLAHTYVYTPHIAENLEKLVKEYGLDGLETHYGTFTGEQTETLSVFCEKHGLYQSGGSDFHGEGSRPQNVLGQAAGAPIDAALVTPWLNKVAGTLL